MATSGNIQSIKDGHSVKEAVVFFSVTPSISAPESYKELIVNGGTLADKYQRYEPVKNITVKFVQQTAETKVEQSQDSGFKLLSFVDGELSSLIQGINQFDKAMFTFNTLKYTNWESFWNQVKECLAAVIAHHTGFLVNSFGLLYIDEFKAVNPKEFQLSQLFNLKSDFVPRTIASSNLLDYNLNFRKEDNDRQWAENLTVKIDNNKNVITINNNVTFAIIPMGFRELAEGKDLEEILYFAHCENKNLLKDLLKADICKMIGL
jgi:uncharacterized protein (TIGR04255 family)